jgi:alpha-galactosidase
MNRLPNNCCARLLALLTAFSADRPLAQFERDTLAATPPIGWNSSNKFASDISEDLIKSVADAMASQRHGGSWLRGFVTDPARFPSGIKALADYVHSVVMVKITP